MSLVSTDDVNALVATGLGEAELQAIIDREEGRLAARLGTPLTGSVSLELRPGRRWDPIHLPRLAVASSVTVSDAEGSIDVDTDGATVTRQSGRWASTPTTIEFDLADEDEIVAAIIDLVRLTVTSSPYHQESAEGHSSTRSATVERTRAQIINQLRPHRGKPMSVPQ